MGTKGDGVIRIRDYKAMLAGIFRRPPDPFRPRQGLHEQRSFQFCSSPARNVMARNPGPGLYLLFIRGRPDADATMQPGMPEIRGVHQMREVNDSAFYLACDTDALVELTPGKGRQARRDGAMLHGSGWSAATAMSFMP